MKNTFVALAGAYLVTLHAVALAIDTGGVEITSIRRLSREDLEEASVSFMVGQALSEFTPSTPIFNLENNPLSLEEGLNNPPLVNEQNADITNNPLGFYYLKKYQGAYEEMGEFINALFDLCDRCQFDERRSSLNTSLKRFKHLSTASYIMSKGVGLPGACFALLCSEKSALPVVLGEVEKTTLDTAKNIVDKEVEKRESQIVEIDRSRTFLHHRLNSKKLEEEVRILLLRYGCDEATILKAATGVDTMVHTYILGKLPKD
jgi:hypothetical protein